MKRSAPLRRTPLKRKRDKPRRNEGRVSHKRSSPRAGQPPDAAQARYHLHLRERKTCQACGCGGDLVLHHILARLPEKKRRDHWWVVLICPNCHNMKEDSVHGLGSEARFYEEHGVDLVAIAAAELRIWESRSAKT